MSTTLTARTIKTARQPDIVDKLPGLVALYNIETGQYTYVNNALKRLLGYEPEDFLNNGVEFVASLIHPDDLSMVMKENQTAITMANGLKPMVQDDEPIVSFEYRMRHVAGHWIWLHTQGSIFNRTALGTVENVINISIDITKRKAAEDKLLRLSQELEHRVAEHAERLELALEASKIGIWEWNIETGALIWSGDMMRLYGLDPKKKDSITYEKFMAALHPDDREMKQNILMHAADTGQPYQVEHRGVWPDGSLHWILGKGKAYMRNGKSYRMVGTAMNIDDRKSAEKLKTKTVLLKAERKELKALNKAKDEFISLASHQLRTPATGVKQYLGMLLQNYMGALKPEQRNAMQKAYHSNERQIKIVNDLLLTAKVDAGEIHLSKQATDIIELLEDVAQEQLAEIASRKQDIKLDLPKSLKAVVDPLYLRTVIENILNNASKYSGDGTIINISAKQKDGKIYIGIQDQGIGIRTEEQSKLYRKFSRIYNDRSGFIDGNGLGLYWSKKIIDLHKGKLLLSSSPDKGSTFTIVLPVK